MMNKSEYFSSSSSFSIKSFDPIGSSSGQLHHPSLTHYIRPSQFTLSALLYSMIAMSLHKYQLWKWKAFVHVIIITTTATIMHHHPQLLLMQMVYTRRQQNDLSTRTTPPHHHHHFTCQLHYHVKPFPIHRHCTILQLYLWIMVMLMVVIYCYPPPHLNDVSLGYSHPQ